MNFSLFSKPPAVVLAQQELEDARRELLNAETTAEYFRSQVEFQKTRIARLERTLAAADKKGGAQ